MKFSLTLISVLALNSFSAEHSITFNFPNSQKHQTIVYKTSPLAQSLYSLFNCHSRTLCLFLPILDRVFGRKIVKAFRFVKNIIRFCRILNEDKSLSLPLVCKISETITKE